VHPREPKDSPFPDHYAHARRPMPSGDEAFWRASLRLSPALADPTYINDTIRCEHSPPLPRA
ncbi:MAG TPA: hypothetical protein VJQ45_12520, partial [Ktedonobacterales bacterium]|nr:hypothetical protein [Ktedonobacterales bacterium]